MKILTTIMMLLTLISTIYATEKNIIDTTSLQKIDPKDASYGKFEPLEKFGWQLNESAKGKNSFGIFTRINPFVDAEKRHKSELFIQLWDMDKGGHPIVTLPFEPLKNGQLTAGAGTAGPQGQSDTISICEGEKVIASIVLANNTNIIVKVAGKELKYVSKKSWFLNAAPLKVIWNDNKLSVSINYHEVCKDETIAGVPNNIKLSVGYYGAANRGLLIDKLKISK